MNHPENSSGYEPPQIIHEEVLEASAGGACSSSFDGMGTCRFDFSACTIAEL